MTLQVAVLGIDGSGKSTLAQALPMAMAAEMNLVAGAAGTEFWVFAPEQDHMAPGFYPRGLPLAASLARACRWLAKRFVDNPGLYPYFKLANMMFQDDAAVSIGRRHQCEVVVSDCNLIMSAIGRASNYKRGVSRNGAQAVSSANDLAAAFALLTEGKPLPPESTGSLPSMTAPGFIARLARLLGFDGVWIPDVVIFLDIEPATALARIMERGLKLDRHENVADMSRARETYLEALKALEAYTGKPCTHVIEVTRIEPREVIKRAVAALRPRIEMHRIAQPAKVLGTPAGSTARSVFNFRYLVRYLLGKWFQGAWREPFFPLSSMGRQLMREGYSAGVMRAIYEQDEVSLGPIERIFTGYPLHRAVYDRLQILSRNLEVELTDRLHHQARVRIFTAPSGFAYDLFRPLEAIASRQPELMEKVEMVAGDLDPHGVLAGELERRAERLGIRFRFVVGDITNPATQRELARSGPHDIALFVGLSSWLPKPQALLHLRWLHEHMSADGVLVTDCFMAAAYALGGRYVGYRANYYSPALYRCMVDYCGFDGMGASVDSGSNRINHVLMARSGIREKSSNLVTQGSGVDRLGDVSAATGREGGILVAGHRMRGERHDGYAGG
jgi:broad-specificity NMP kinase